VFCGVNSDLLDRLLKITGTSKVVSDRTEIGLMSRVKLMIDAEHTWYQPALDAFTLLLSEEFNKPQVGETNWRGPLILYVLIFLPWSVY
jgi:hypothetical protein